MEPITASYVQENSDWTITVSGLGRELTARAPGIIAARDRADQLVEKIAGEQSGRTVVHLLHGSALEFTAAYMQARMARPAPPENAETAAPSTAQGTAAARGTAAGEGRATKANGRKTRSRSTAKPPSTARRAKKDTEPDFEGKVSDVNGVLNGDVPEQSSPAKA